MVRQGSSAGEERVIAYEVTDDPFEHTPLLRTLLARPDPPTALITWNDILAASFIRSARLLGIDVPGQLSIAGFNETAVARVTSPRLTTVQLPLFEMGREAAELLIGRLQGRESSASPAQRVLASELAIRESCAPPAAGP